MITLGKNTKITVCTSNNIQCGDLLYSLTLEYYLFDVKRCMMSRVIPLVTCYITLRIWKEINRLWLREIRCLWEELDISLKAQLRSIWNIIHFVEKKQLKVDIVMMNKCPWYDMLYIENSG